MNTQKRQYRKPVQRVDGPFEAARDELFQHIMRCGVIGSMPADQQEWFDNTIQYLQDRYHELSPAQLSEIRVLGERFAAPAKAQVAV